MSSPPELNVKISMDTDQSDEISWSFAMQVACGSVLPMALRAAIELDVLQLIKKAEPNAISASEIAAQLPTNNPDATTLLDRLLRFLTAHSVLNCTLKTVPDCSNVERHYSLAPVCKFLTKNEDGVSIAPLLMMVQDRVFMETWYHLKDTILEGGIPFNRAYGMSAFEYPATDPRFNNIFNQGMSNHSRVVMKKILEIYKGFEGLNSLVDIGGGIGATLDMIISKYPSIKGINFDLPHVIQDAPSYHGVKHIGGDMFVSVPNADAIFMKWICHDWSDAHCKKLLKNCYESLPSHGKVIVVEHIYPEDGDENSEMASKRAAQFDMMMLAYNPGGKERTEKEFHALAKEAGFNAFRKICCVFNMSIIEFYK